jgi:hypothetical protein
MSFKKVGKAGGNPLAPIFRWTDDKKTAHQEKAIKGKITDKSDRYKRSLSRDAQLALGAKRLKTSRYDEFGREKGRK